ncbi:ATP-binding protein [Deinococcus apachensis]|uniref:ATP-binding protein n=1 Tax=Deinococcus apachensis TaxID=309886 RepID=UPI00037776D5|nr:AAA family ATPase [Deinococcus apachensis]
MSAPFRVQLLGQVQGHFGGAPVPFLRDRRHLLLAYLAAQDTWVGRERLAFLFWPDDPGPVAYQNLRRLLQRVRALPWLRGLEVTATQVRWAVPTDVAAWEQARAPEGYGGSFLASLEPINLPELAAWAAAERERLQGLQRDRILARAREGPPEEALTLLTPLLHGEAPDDEALAEYLRAAARAGQRERGMREFRRYAMWLRDELGLDPSPGVMQALREDSAAPPDLVPAHTPVPSAVTSFVGRDLEIAEVLHLLRGPDHRLVTLIGPGGVGKTRLAARLAQETAPHFAQGAAFVPLEAARDEAELVSTLARAVPVPLPQVTWPQVRRALAACELLLVLDNLEHLPGAASLITDLLTAAPRVRVLATSRAPLGLLAETQLVLEGLPFPPGPEAWDDGYDGVRLFTERARHVDPHFVIPPEDRAHLLRLGESVGGLPLALELAATWVRLLPLREVADAVGAGLDLLHADLADLPPRQRSLRAVLEKTWALLPPPEQEALRALGSVDTPFHLRAVGSVTGVTPLTLRHLEAQGLIRRLEGGHLNLHPLVRQFAAERAADYPQEAEAVRRRHAEYYARFLADRPRPPNGGLLQACALDEIAGEIENVRMAWRWMVNHAADDLLNLCLDPLWQFCEGRGRHPEGIPLFRLAAGQTELPRPTRGRLLVRLGICLLHASPMREAERALLQSLTLLKGTGHDRDLQLAYVHLSMIAEAQGHPRRAMTINEVGLREAQRTGHRWSEDGFITRLALGAQAMGDLPRARALHERRLRSSEALQDVFGLALCTSYLAGVSLLEERYDEAEQFFLQGIRHWRSLGNPGAVAHLVRRLGDLAYVQGNFRAASAHYTESAALYTELGYPDEAERIRLRAGHARLSHCDREGAQAALDAAREVGAAALFEWQTLQVRLLAERENPSAQEDALLPYLRRHLPWHILSAEPSSD